MMTPDAPYDGPANANVAAKGRRPIVWHLVVLALGAAAPFAALTAFLAVELLDKETSKATAMVQHQAQASAEDIDLEIARTRRILVELAKRAAIAALDPQRCDPMLGDLVRLDPQFAAIFTLDASGRIVCSSAPQAETSRLPHVVTAAARKAFALGSPMREPAAGKWAIQATQPIIMARGEVAGFVGITLDLVALSSHINQRGVAAGTVVGLLDPAGTVITRQPDAETWVGRDVAQSPIGRIALQRRAGTARAKGVLGVDRLWAFVPVPETDWVVLAGIPTQAVLAPAPLTGWIAALGALGVCFVILLCIYIARPIAAIAESARRMSASDSVERLAPSGPAEIAALADDLNQMLERRMAAERALRESEAHLRDSLGERMHAAEDVRRLNAALELRVLERTTELEAVNRELESFDYSIAHDLRAPLNRIRGFGDALVREYAGQLPAEGTELVRRIQASGESMDRLVTDLLSLSMIARGEIHRTDVDLSATARNITDALQSTEPGRRVEIVIAPGVRARADPGLVHVVLENLLANAWKFTSGREHARIEFGCDRNDAESRYYVRDNGAGFDAALAGKLFQPFHRLHAQSEFPGTGVGLATVQRIVRRHGGRVWAEGDVGRGATFGFTVSP